MGSAPTPAVDKIEVPPFSESMREALQRLPAEAQALYLAKKTAFYRGMNESDIDIESE